MSEESPPPSAPPAQGDEAKLERLRDRTDEIELIISGLTTVALFTLPGWLFETLMTVHSHHTVIMTMGANIALILVPGLFYVLGFCFAIHLMIRAYWAGLIGLRTVFPQGIDWKRTPGLGPVGRRYYQDNLPDLSRAIAKADHLASSLFAVISLVALGMIWASILIGAIVAGAGFIGSQTGHTNLAITLATLVSIVFMVGSSMLLWLLDAKFGRWFPGLQARPGYRKLVHILIRFNNVVSPQRLILPVQLTLQSNTHPRLFSFLFAVGIAMIIVVGSVVYSRWTQFSVSEEFRYLDDETVAQGFRSTYYENLRSSRDRIRFYPMIDRFVQQEAVLTVFIPYYPLRDNLVMDNSCDARTPRLDCLRGLWQVSLGDRTLAPDELIPAERFDLNLRGLMGVVPLDGLEPGRHTLSLRWNVDGDASQLDDRYEVENLNYDIPFVFAPAYEIGLERPAAGSEETTP
ncbi:MAG: hypothetical protein GVY11_01325 [Gammaproteobacteria bacterium]|jgi:hypothetical protein|nr:hypothetical protein [Gammaproteobacteria bacterium]